LILLKYKKFLCCKIFLDIFFFKKHKFFFKNIEIFLIISRPMTSIHASILKKSIKQRGKTKNINSDVESYLKIIRKNNYAGIFFQDYTKEVKS